MDETVELILQLLVTSANLYAQYQAAASAQDQASLDAIHQQAVAASNALAPAGGIAPVAVD